MLEFGCPACGHKLNLKQPKAGKFRPACTSCKEVFQIVIEDDLKTIRTGRLNPAGPVDKKDANQPKEKTAASPAEVFPKAPQPPTKSPPKSPSATGQTQPAATAKPQPSVKNPGAANPGTADQTFDRSSGATNSSESDQTMDHSTGTTKSGPADQTFDHSPSVAKSSPADKTFDKPSSTATRPGNWEEETMESAGSRAKQSQGDFSVAAAAVPQLNTRLGGYRLVSELGRGGLGVVYLAQQLSLNRNVALKLIQSHLAGRSTAVSRFFREAYAAAQLTHHNVVQIYDMGQDAGTNFFSMELVRGKNLAEVISEKGALDPRQAAGYILQAARGLHFAHEQGMVHRDVKPANLMLDAQGVVKVADLGLVKVGAMDESDSDQPSGSGPQGSQSAALTAMGTTVGTAHFIAPEQAKDASSVDLRADIYSLGCTFYTLLTGKPPYSGNTAQIVIHKHQSEPLVPPVQLGLKIDQRLSDIVMKMVEKNPDRRYTSLAPLITDLESWMGLDQKESYAPTTQQAELLTKSQQEFNKSPLVWLRGIATTAIAGILLLIAVISMFVNWRWGVGTLFALPLVPGTLLAVAGFRQRSPLFSKMREWIALGGWRMWITLVMSLLLLVTIFYAVGLLLPWLVMSILTVAAMAGCYFGIDETLFRKRESTLGGLQKMLRSLRVSGVDENKIRGFVAEYSGRDWEEFFEHLFGYQALKTARTGLAKQSGDSNRRRFRPWRDKIVGWIDEQISERRQERDVDRLRAVERQALVAGGASPAEAAREADRISEMLVSQGAELRAAAASGPAQKQSSTASSAAEKRARFQAMMAAARNAPAPTTSRFKNRTARTLDAFLGSHVRLILGALLLTGCVLWLKQNEFFSFATWESLQSAATSAIKSGDATELQNQAQSALSLARKPFAFPLFGGMVSNFNAGLAGLILLGSVFFRGWKAGIVFIAIGVAIWLGGLFGIPGLGPWV